MVYFKELESDENYEKSQSVQPISTMRYESGTY